MTNQEVLKSFLQGYKAKTPTRDIQNGYYSYKGNTLTTDGTTLINYQETIAYKEGNKLYLNKGKYSVTTSKIQSQLKRLATDFYNDKNIIYYEQKW